MGLLAQKGGSSMERYMTATSRLFPRSLFHGLLPCSSEFRQKLSWRDLIVVRIFVVVARTLRYLQMKGRGDVHVLHGYVKECCSSISTWLEFSLEMIVSQACGKCL